MQQLKFVNHTALIASKSYFSQSVHILHTVIVANQTQTSMACTRRRQGTVEQANTHALKPQTIHQRHSDGDLLPALRALECAGIRPLTSPVLANSIERSVVIGVLKPLDEKVSKNILA